MRDRMGWVRVDWGCDRSGWGQYCCMHPWLYPDSIPGLQTPYRTSQTCACDLACADLNSTIEQVEAQCGLKKNVPFCQEDIQTTNLCWIWQRPFVPAAPAQDKTGLSKIFNWAEFFQVMVRKRNLVRKAKLNIWVICCPPILTSPFGKLSKYTPY